MAYRRRLAQKVYGWQALQIIYTCHQVNVSRRIHLVKSGGNLLQAAYFRPSLLRTYL
jgi:hypothetical protein